MTIHNKDFKIGNYNIMLQYSWTYFSVLFVKVINEPNGDKSGYLPFNFSFGFAAAPNQLNMYEFCLLMGFNRYVTGFEPIAHGIKISIPKVFPSIHFI